MKEVSFNDRYIYHSDIVLPTLGDCIIRLYLGGNRIDYCEKVDELNRSYGINLSKPDSNADAIVERDGHTVYVWLERNSGSLIVHEIIHIIDRVYGIIGADIRCDELTAYLAEYLFRIISEHFNRRDVMVKESNKSVCTTGMNMPRGDVIC